MIRNIYILLLLSLSFGIDHLLITQVVTQPDAAESFSIYNPTDSPIDLTNYYICDDEEYYKMQTEENMAPSSSISGFTARFPSISINSGDTLHVILNSDYSGYYGEEFTPDIIMYGAENNSMLETEPGSIGFSAGKLDETSELLILFYWDDDSESLIQDVDYFLWSSLGGITEVVDKTGIGDYLDDTTLNNQLFFEESTDNYYGYSRIGIEESNELVTGGNGISGHDETSENFRESWEIIPLFNIGCMDPNAYNYNPDAVVNDHNCITATLESIINGEHNSRIVTVEGLIVDYFDITIFNGPHSLTISDSLNNEVEISIWPNVMNNELLQLTKYPLSKYRVLVSGEVRLYPDSNNNGICDEPKKDTNCSLPSSSWECSSDDYNNIFNIDELSRNSLSKSNEIYDHCSWQIELGNSSSLNILEIQQISYPDVEFSDLLSYNNDIKNSPYFHKNIMITGVIVDYFDATQYCGPHILTIEDNSNYRLEIISFDSNWSSMLSCIVYPPLKEKVIQVMGYVGEYENEIQISIDNESQVELLDVLKRSGDFESDSSIEDISINPAPYVIIPSLGETLDFSFTVLKETRAIVRIFDLSGRFITSLVDDVYEFSGKVSHEEGLAPWDGRDQLGQIVSPGTYIMYLEVFSPATGETKTDAAPIVVGVKN